MLFTEVTSFVGRETEVSEVSGFLEHGRLVTIAGPGGVGKTRVALQAARRAAREAEGRFADGAHVAELSGLTDPGLLPNTIAASLGMPRLEARQQLDAVREHLRDRRLLLLLDTCEHLIEACALFAEDMLRVAPGLTILATSRQPLDADGEQVFTLAPFPVPDPGTGNGAGPGAGDAVELFGQRAAAADHDFTVSVGNWPDVVRVCRRLEGIPLAIELAAVRLRALSLRDLADQLDERFDALATRHGGPARQRTLDATIGWSYDLCTEAERGLWARLSVFAGSFGLAGAREVCGGGQVPEKKVVTTLVSLVDKSVLMRDGDRYRMLDTIREFGAGKLAGSGQEAATRERHLAWYLRAARSAADHFLDHDQPARIRALRAEHDNLRAALGYALGSGSGSGGSGSGSGGDRLARDGAGLASALYGYWMASGRLREGRHWLGLALEKLPAGPSPERAWALVSRSFLGPSAGVPAEAEAEGAEGVAMARELGDNGLLLARGCLFHQFALMFCGRNDEAYAAGNEARRRLEPLKDRVGLVILEAQMAHLNNLAGDLPAALESCVRALDRLREGSPDGEIGEQWMHGFIYLNAGLALYFQGAHEKSEWCFRRALSIQVKQDDTLGCGYALEALGWLAVGKAEWDTAAWLLGAADARWRELGARLGNNALLEEFHRQMVDAVRQGLGRPRYEELLAGGAGSPLEQVAGKYPPADGHILTV